MTLYIPPFDNLPTTTTSIINKHWYTLHDSIRNKLIQYCNKNHFTTILEVGPGTSPFPIANYTIDVTRESTSNQFNLDIDKDKIPLENQFIDFGYARHVWEDIQNPDYAFNEMKRVCKTFYLETPSPMIEILRGIDGFSHAFPYRGYIHHRYFVWSKNNTIHFFT